MSRAAALTAYLAISSMPAALAEDAPAPLVAATTSPTTGGQAPDSSGIEEIVVTAQRRSENVQNVPISVSTVTSSQLASENINDVRDLSVAVPTLTLKDTNGYLTASIRGVGGNAVGPGVENQVALYIDDVYYGSPAGSLLSLNNIEQIAVLKGPQGTLFGRNATGGVIQVTSRDPGDTPSGDVNVTYANYDTTLLTAYVGGPLSDTLKADIAVEGRHQGEGWGRDVDPSDGSELYNEDYEYATRSKILFTPVDGTRFTLIGDYSATRNTLEAPIPAPGRINGFAPQLGPAPDLGYDGDFDGPDLHTGFASGVSLKAEQDAGPVEFVNIVAYRRDRYDFDFDYSATPLPEQNIYARQKDHQFSEEFRIQSTSQGKLKWVVGAFYYYDKSGWDNFLLQAYDLGADVNVHDFQTTNSEAGFGQATYEVLPDTNFTVGVRYTSEVKRAVEQSETVGPIDAAGGATTPFPDQQADASKATYRASIDHRFNDEVLSYLSYNTGFKSGGFNTGAPGSAPYLPEKLDATELGIKTDLLDKRLRIDVAGFYYQYTDIQVQTLTDGSITTVNGASAKLYGMDLDLTAAVTENLRITSGLGWTHDYFTSFPDCPFVAASGGVASVTANCAGNQIPLSSKLLGNVAADYLFHLPVGSLDVNGNVYYNSGTYFTPDNNFGQGAYFQPGVSVKWTDPRGHFSVSLWGKNLNDKRIISYTAVNNTNGTAFNTYFAPLTYGLTLHYDF